MYRSVNDMTDRHAHSNSKRLYFIPNCFLVELGFPVCYSNPIGVSKPGLSKSFLMLMSEFNAFLQQHFFQVRLSRSSRGRSRKLWEGSKVATTPLSFVLLNRGTHLPIYKPNERLWQKILRRFVAFTTLWADYDQFQIIRENQLYVKKVLCIRSSSSGTGLATA